MRIGVPALCLLLAGCGVLGDDEAGSSPSSSGTTGPAASASPSRTPSSSPSPTSGAGATESAEQSGPPRVRWARALVALERGGPRDFVVLLSDSGATVLRAEGSFDPRTHKAEFDLLISQPLRPGERFGGPVIAVGEERYLQRTDSCWERVQADEFNGPLGITDATVGLKSLDVLRRSRLLGESLASPDVLRLRFELADVLHLFGAAVPLARVPGTVEGEVEILDGEVTEWSISGNALAEALPPQVPRKLRAQAGNLAYGVSYRLGDSESIRRPPDAKVAPSPGTPCRNGEDAEV